MTTRTLGALAAQTAEGLAGAHVPEPRREALRLLGDLTGLAPGDVLLRSDAPASAELVTRAAAAVRRRASGEPFAYVSGWAGFRTLTLEVDRRVLIPRPETEQLVELVLQAQPRGRVVDVGAGSGCVALSLAQEGSYNQVVAIDRSGEALAVARGNAGRLGIPVLLLQGDLVTAVRAGSCDAVVSNPPYLTEAEHASLEPGVRDWEPALALVSGPDGLVAIRRLVEEAATVLTPGGLLALEVDSSRAAQVAVLAGCSGWSDVAVIKDLFGRDRFLTARRGPKQ